MTQDIQREIEEQDKQEIIQETQGWIGEYEEDERRRAPASERERVQSAAEEFLWEWEIIDEA